MLDTKGQILYDSTQVKYTKRQNQRDRTSMRSEQGLEKGENGKLLLNGYRVYVRGNEKILETKL